MRILHLLLERWDSGITAYALQIARLQQQEGHEILMGLNDEKKPKELAEAVGLPWVPCKSVWQARKLIRQSSWDIINVHNGKPHTWAVLVRMFSGQSVRKIPIVRTRGDARALSHHPFMKIIYRTTDGVICLSEHIREQYVLHYNFLDRKLKTIYPSVQAENYEPPADKTRIGILGRLDPIKGHTVFLEAAARILAEFPTATFQVAGGEANFSIELLKNHARDLGILGRVQFLGYINDVRGFMQSCAIGVVPSLGSEEVSRAGLEWMSMGRPLVGSLVGCLPEIIDTGVTGQLVPPGDSVALSDALLSYLRHPEGAEEAGRRAQEQVRLRFNPSVQLKKTIELYRECSAARGLYIMR